MSTELPRLIASLTEERRPCSPRVTTVSSSITTTLCLDCAASGTRMLTPPDDGCHADHRPRIDILEAADCDQPNDFFAV
jgi:hypothetical protein